VLLAEWNFQGYRTTPSADLPVNIDSIACRHPAIEFGSVSALNFVSVPAAIFAGFPAKSANSIEGWVFSAVDDGPRLCLPRKASSSLGEDVRSSQLSELARLPGRTKEGMMGKPVRNCVVH
jgi:hypothetical protein